MEINITGTLELSHNPIFAEDNQHILSKDIKHLIITVFNKDDMKKLINVIKTYNESKEIDKRFSFPISFVKDNNVTSALVKFKFSNSNSGLFSSITNYIGSTKTVNPLYKTPLKDWIGKEYKIRFGLRKYIFTQSLNTNDEVVEGGSTNKLKGFSFIIISLDIV
jgi:sulfatase maturation enzyme AslB (radical SAM superfamily)